MSKLTFQQSDALREVIKRCGKTQTELSDKCGIAQSRLSEILRGRKHVNNDVANKLYELLGKDDSLDFLLALKQKSADYQREPWRALFYTPIQKLEKVYHRHNYTTRVSILEDLEKLVEKYKED